jgi:streptomycin 6-kinase
MTPFDRYLAAWNLVPDGAPMRTPSSHLLPVRRGGEPAMLKIAHADEERRGVALMRWWDGDGAARVLAHDGDALLLERATGPRSLRRMAIAGEDDEACRILCAVAARLHAPRPRPPPVLTPLRRWFAGLEAAARAHGGLFARAWDAACRLLDDPREVVPLHGDLHHDNVLDAGARGWIAIDPKHVIGERGFDLANLFANPDAHAAQAPGRFAHRVHVVAAAAGCERRRLLRWVLAQAGLSAAWLLADGEAPDDRLAIARLAAAELERS